LVERRLHAVIAMQYRVSDAAAIRLSTTFYRALADGQPVDAAQAGRCEASGAEAVGLDLETLLGRSTAVIIGVVIL
jgi:hypothetical protein